MTLKEELEILRGEPIEVFTGDPMDIPCIETSDPEKLCKHPVVSVHMITYNHEPYIRQAIEGVMMQKTDFEFELVIGEDCSQDKTREICFEYQKKYPDRIRILWWHENLRKVKHPAGGNGKRNLAHCRGEFIAFCEGDDYWIDPLKLQKQVEVMRTRPNVSFCFAGGQISVHGEERARHWNNKETYRPGLVRGDVFFLKYMFGVRFDEGDWPASNFLLTASILIRAQSHHLAKNRYEVMNWRLFLGDTPTWLGLASVGDAYYLPDEVCVYNQLASGACRSTGDKVGRDGLLVRLYYYCQHYERPFSDLPNSIHSSLYFYAIVQRFDTAVGVGYRNHIKAIASLPHLKCVVYGWRFLFVTFCLLFANSPCPILVGRYLTYCLNPMSDPRWLKQEYVRFGEDYRNDGNRNLMCRIIVGLKNFM